MASPIRMGGGGSSSSSLAVQQWNAVNQVFQQEGVPTGIWQSIAVAEGNNAAAVGDHNTSFGLFQDHIGGQLPQSWASSAQRGQGPAFNPVDNAKAALPAIAQAYKQGRAMGFRGVKLAQYTASHSGHPGFAPAGVLETSATASEGAVVASAYTRWGNSQHLFQASNGSASRAGGSSSPAVGGNPYLRGRFPNMQTTGGGPAANTGQSNPVASQTSWGSFLTELHRVETFNPPASGVPVLDWGHLAQHDLVTIGFRTMMTVIGLVILVLGMMAVLSISPSKMIGGMMG